MVSGDYWDYTASTLLIGQMIKFLGISVGKQNIYVDQLFSKVCYCTVGCSNRKYFVLAVKFYEAIYDPSNTSRVYDLSGSGEMVNVNTECRKSVPYLSTVGQCQVHAT